tara:strand:- start:708 stop:1040 length:333 start_codon:yes stop_codon:yes gene_type:complete
VHTGASNGEEIHQEEGWSGESYEGRNATREATPMAADGEPHLAGSGPGKKLTKRDQACIGFFFKPLELLDEDPAEVSEVRGRTSKAGATQKEKSPEYFEDGFHLPLIGQA